MKILFLSKYPDATSHYRCLIPSKYLSKIGHDVRHNYFTPVPNIPGSGISPQDVDWADVIVFQRPFTDEEHDAVKQIKERRPNKILVGEYDDDYYNVPGWNPGYTYLKAKANVWHKILDHYDGVITSTYNLQNLLSQDFKKDMVVIKNAIDWEDFDNFVPVESHQIVLPEISDDLIIRPYKVIDIKEFNEINKDKIVIGWFGSRTHYCDLDIISDDLLAISEEHKDVAFLFMGYMHFRFVPLNQDDKLYLASGITPVKRYYDLLKTLKIDISLCPVMPVKFNESKSNIKYQESAACGFVPVCSEFDTYEDGFYKGYLADYRHGSWRDKINEAIELIRSGDHVEKVIKPNKEYVRECYDASDRSIQYVNFFQQLAMKKLKRKV